MASILLQLPRTSNGPPYQRMLTQPNGARLVEEGATYSWISLLAPRPATAQHGGGRSPAGGGRWFAGKGEKDADGEYEDENEEEDVAARWRGTNHGGYGWQLGRRKDRRGGAKQPKPQLACL